MGTDDRVRTVIEDKLIAYLSSRKEVVAATCSVLMPGTKGICLQVNDARSYASFLISASCRVFVVIGPRMNADERG
jgi:hypothetical protein